MFNKLRRKLAGLIWTALPPRIPRKYTTPDECTVYQNETGLYTVYVNGLIQRQEYDYRCTWVSHDHFLIDWTDPIWSDDVVEAR